MNWREEICSSTVSASFPYLHTFQHPVFVRKFTTPGLIWETPLSISPEELSQNNTLAEGQIFEGRYQILSVLGRGGVGVVYKARHMHMDKIMAIKTLLPSVVTDDAESFQRFEREARTASSLDHVNIIKIFDFGKTASGLAFLVMEYLGDQTLRESAA
jgi:serine/threonine-protein kinase